MAILRQCRDGPAKDGRGPVLFPPKKAEPLHKRALAIWEKAPTQGYCRTGNWMMLSD
jgi:hypothetical protein